MFSGSWEEHQGYMRQVLSALRKVGLTANPSKCQWGGGGGGEHIEFLGRHMTSRPFWNLYCGCNDEKF